MKNILNRLQELVDKLQSDSSSNTKIKYIQEYLHDSELKKLLFYIHNPFYQFYVTSTTCGKYFGYTSNWDGSIFDVLDSLRNRTVTGHQALGLVNAFIRLNPEHKELINNIIDKDLKCRIGESLINKAVPGTIPSFDVALAEKFEPELVNFKTEEWYVSRKLDGVRCAVVIDENGKVTSFSRQGKIFETLGVVEEFFSNSGLRSVVFDGEICMVDKDGNEDFQSIMKEIRRKNHTISNVKYKLFDCLTLEEFYNKISVRKLSERLTSINHFIDGVVEYLPQEIIRDLEHFQEWIDKANDGSWEGIMLRKNTRYQGKRSKNLLKVKKFSDAEYVVEGITYGEIRMLVDGKEVTETMTSQIMIRHKGYEVGVGSGFSLDQRLEFFRDPSKIVGKTITVQYFEETHNQEGGISLRFPVIKHIFEGGRNV